MVQRILDILAESKRIWPLVSRWYDHLESFYGNKDWSVETEGSMANGVSAPGRWVPYQCPVLNFSQEESIQPRPPDGQVDPTIVSLDMLMSFQQSPSPAATHAVYPSQPVPQPRVVPAGQQQKHLVPAHGQQYQETAQTAGVPGQAAFDGAGWLVGPFDAHQTAVGLTMAPATTGVPAPYSPLATTDVSDPYSALAMMEMSNSCSPPISTGVPDTYSPPTTTEVSTPYCPPATDGLLASYSHSATTWASNPYSQPAITGKSDPYSPLAMMGMLDPYSPPPSTGVLDSYPSLASTGVPDLYPPLATIRIADPYSPPASTGIPDSYPLPASMGVPNTCSPPALTGALDSYPPLTSTGVLDLYPPLATTGMSNPYSPPAMYGGHGYADLAQQQPQQYYYADEAAMFLNDGYEQQLDQYLIDGAAAPTMET